MGTVQTAIEAAARLDLPAETEEGFHGDVYVFVDDYGNKLARLYLGSYAALDPCGRYHCAVALNGMTARCAAFWESLTTQLRMRDCYLADGQDGDDVVVERWLYEAEEVHPVLECVA